MKNIFCILSVLFIVVGCKKENSENSNVLRGLDISDAKILYVETTKNVKGVESNILYKIRHDETKVRVPLLSISGNEINPIHIGVAKFNSDYLIFTYSISNYDSGRYLFFVDKKTNNVVRVFDDIWPLFNLIVSHMDGYTDSYNDNQGNLYYRGHLPRGSSINKYKADFTKEIISGDYELTGEFAVDASGNVIMQIYEGTWLYRSKDGEFLTFQMPDIKYGQFADNITVFGLHNRDGFYFIRNDKEGLEMAYLCHLRYNSAYNKMESSVISSTNEYMYTLFECIYYYEAKVILISKNVATIIDEHDNLSNVDFVDQSYYSNYSNYSNLYKFKNAFYWFYDSLNGAKRFNLLTQTVEDVYYLDNYRIDATNIEPDGSVTIYGLNINTGQKVMVNVNNGIIISEKPWTDGQTRNIHSWLEL